MLDMDDAVAVAAQRDSARAKANEHRRTIREYKAALRSLPRYDAAERLADFLEAPDNPDALEAAPLWALLTSINRLGDAKAALAMRSAGVLAPDKRVRNLTERQRRVLAEWLRDWAAYTQSHGKDRRRLNELGEVT
jgi:hypothetical protein